MIKTTFIGSLFATLLLAFPAHATEYIYRDIMANTLAPEHCQAESKAKENATKNYNIDRFSKKFCQSQGYGWHVDEVKSVGNTVCDSCGNAQEARCHQEDVVVACKRIKPGTVGMLPGKG